MDFRSILFLDDAESADVAEPAYFRDLNLDQIVEAVAARETEFDIRPFFRRALSTADAVRYRQEAVRDLERDDVIRLVRTFCDRMRTMRAQLEQRDKLHYDLQQFRWLLQAVQTYCSAVIELSTEMRRTKIESRAFGALREYLDRYAVAATFQTLLTESRRIASALADIQYCVLVGTGYVTVRPYETQPDYSIEIAATFEKFRRASAKDYRTTFNERPYMNHVEEHILGFVAKLRPEVFDSLRRFAVEHEDFRDRLIMRFDLEVRFYIAYLDHVATFRAAGLAFSYPALAANDKHVSADATFDLALANNLLVAHEPVVLNDFTLCDAERIFIISGPNQGGKTTFARTFGQLHHLAALGLPVPGSKARLFVFDRMFTHFDREESIDTLRGKLQEDLARIRDIVDAATSRSVIIINEIFSSTTLADATILASKVFERIVALDALCVCVTFLVDIARLSPSVVSLVSEVLPDQPDVRTFKVVRATADGRSYAQSIAEKYRLTYDLLKDRIRP